MEPRDAYGRTIERGAVVGTGAGAFGVVCAFGSCDPSSVHVIWVSKSAFLGAGSSCEVATRDLYVLGKLARDCTGVILTKGDQVEIVRQFPASVIVVGRHGMLHSVDLERGTCLLRTLACDFAAVPLNALRLLDRTEATRRLDMVARLISERIFASDKPQEDEEPDDGSNIDHEFTSFPTCPWCGYEVRDLTDHGPEVYSEDEHDIECGNCERTFRSTCHISYSFSTMRVDLDAERRERERVAAEIAREHEELRKLAGAFQPGMRVRIRSRVFNGRPFYAPHIEGRPGKVANCEIGRTGDLRVELDAWEHNGHPMSPYTMRVDPRDIEAIR